MVECAQERHLAYHGLYLGREHVYPAHHKHIVGPAGEPVKAGVCASAGAFLPHKAGYVPYAVSYKREGLLLEHGHDHLPPLAVLAGLAVPVKYLYEAQVRPDVYPLLFAAFQEHGARHLAGPVAVVNPYAGPLLELLPHALGPWLPSCDGLPDLRIPAYVNALLVADVRYVEYVGRGAGQRCHRKVEHELDLPVGVACARGKHRRPHFLPGCVNPQAACEQSVAVAVLQHVILAHSEGDHPPGKGL